jgi:UDP-4-amino-4,6-dideoxy-N-acetyl-beta-L-altrosamine N-acetyltransferase
MLRLEDCKLRPVAERDLDILLAWRNSPAIRRNMFNDHIITPEEHRAWFERSRNSKHSSHLLFLHGDRPLGTVNVRDIDHINGRCVWGFYIGDPGAPKGSGVAMACLAIDYIFNTIGMRKICSEAFAFNTASINYHGKLGFCEEGRLRAHQLKEGKYEDIIIFGLFRHEWEEVRPRLIAAFGR